MKRKSTAINQTKVQLCSLPANAIEINGEIFLPDSATAYVEFYLAHTFPVYLDQAAAGERADFSTLHPQVVANSYRSLKGKVVNLAHMMRAYDPKKYKKDFILGTVMAVEFPTMPEGGWKLSADPAAAHSIRAVAALHKNAEGVQDVIDTWNEGKTLFSDTPWTVSMENECYMDVCGFLIEPKGTMDVLAPFTKSTPEDLAALGWCYVPYTDAPKELIACMKAGDYIGMAKDYCGCRTLFMNGGLTGSVFFYGVALTPAGKVSAARVGRIVAGQELVDVSAGFDAIAEFVKRIGDDCAK